MKTNRHKERISWLLGKFKWVLGLCVAAVLTGVINGFYDDKVQPFFCDSDGPYSQGQLKFREAREFSKRARDFNSQSDFESSMALYNDAVILMNEASKCGSRDAAQVLVIAYCRGAFGVPNNRDKGMEILRKRLTPADELPTREMIEDLCPLD